MQAMLNYMSKLIYNESSNSRYYETDSLSKEEWKDYWELFSDKQVEEIVGLYLQFEKGYKIYTTTKTISTPLYEFVMVNEKNERAIVQVKSGNTSLDYRKYLDLSKEYKVYLFAVCENYCGTPSKNDNIYIIEKEDINQFIMKYKKILPKHVQYWIDM